MPLDIAKYGIIHNKKHNLFKLIKTSFKIYSRCIKNNINKLCNNKKNIIFMFFIILLILILELDRESSLYTINVMSGVKNFYHSKPQYTGPFFMDEYVSIDGSWNVTYKNNLNIKCTKEDFICTIIQADLMYKTLSVFRQDFEIKEWNKEYIKAYDKGTQYNYELYINLKNEDVTYTKHPLSKNGVFGQKLDTSIYKLYDGWKLDMNIASYKTKNASWFKAPLLKIFYIFNPLRKDIKIDLQ